MRVSELDVDPRVVAIMEQMGIQKLYPPQAKAAPYAIAGKNLVVAIPTASGKSMVAYLAVLDSVLKGGKAVYLVPLRALAWEKYEELKRFEELGLRVGLSMGDFESADPDLKRFDIIVATSEKVDALLRNRADWLNQISVVVADEVHLINDLGRGPTLEIILSRFMQVNPKAQIIALSATIANSIELAGWLKAEHISSNWRPVELKLGVHCEKVITYTDRSTYKPDLRSDPSEDVVLDTINDGGQALVFVNSRRSTEAVSERLSKLLARKMELSEEQKGDLDELAIEVETGGSEPTAYGKKLGACIRGGAAFHNAGLTNRMRRLVERGFRSRAIRVIVATPTLAAGINLPARRVLIRDTRRFDGDLGMSPIPVLEIQQMCGRAGRPGLDPHGEAILVSKSERQMALLMDKYLLGESEPIRSRLGSMPALRTHLLASVACGFAHTRKELDAFIESTFFAYTSEVWTIGALVDDTLEFLVENDLLQEEDGTYHATSFGSLTSRLYIDPLSAINLRKTLDAAGGGRDVATFPFLLSISSTPDMLKLYLRQADYKPVMAKFRDHEDELLIAPPVAPNEFDWFLSEVKTTMLLHDWVNEVNEDSILKRFNIGPGDVRNRVETARWLLHAFSQLAGLLNPRLRHPLQELTARMENGIKSELMDLLVLHNIGRIRARALFSAGYRNRGLLYEASEKELAKLPSIGKVIAKDILEQIG